MSFKREKRVDFSHVVRALLTLLRAEKEGRELSMTEFIRESGIPSSTFYTTVRDALIDLGLITVESNPRERVVIIKLTDKGRKLAQCFEDVGVEV